MHAASLFDGLSFDGFPPFEYGPNRLLLASIFWRPLGVTPSTFLVDGLLKQLCHVVSTGGSVDEDGLNFMLSVVKGIENPQEAIREADRCHSVADLSAVFWVALLNVSYSIAFSWRYIWRVSFLFCFAPGATAQQLRFGILANLPSVKVVSGEIDAGKGSALLNGVLVLTAILEGRSNKKAAPCGGTAPGGCGAVLRPTGSL